MKILLILFLVMICGPISIMGKDLFQEVAANLACSTGLLIPLKACGESNLVVDFYCCESQCCWKLTSFSYCAIVGTCAVVLIIGICVCCCRACSACCTNSSSRRNDRRVEIIQFSTPADPTNVHRQPAFPNDYTKFPTQQRFT